MKIRQIVEKHLHDNIITLYDMGIIQKKAQKAWEKFEENKIEEVSV